MYEITLDMTHAPALLVLATPIFLAIVGVTSYKLPRTGSNANFWLIVFTLSTVGMVLLAVLPMAKYPAYSRSSSSTEDYMERTTISELKSKLHDEGVNLVSYDKDRGLARVSDDVGLSCLYNTSIDTEWSPHSHKFRSTVTLEAVAESCDPNYRAPESLVG